jgi:osmoprotectant transport system ATP-binding protein
VIALEGVEKSYGAGSAERGRALGPVTFEVAGGRRVAVVGPSGCGKSTLVRMIVGLVRPDRGRVIVDGVEVNDATKRALRQRIGYVIQEGGLFPHLTAEGNVTLVARHLAWDKARIEARVAALAEMASLDRGALARWPLELSGGQRQRVGILRALMLDPAVLVMDEPLGALDPVTRRRLQGELLALFRAMKKTVVLVTHDIEEAAFLADETVVLRDGRIVQRGTVEEMGRAPADGFVRDLLAGVRGPS